MKKVLFLILVLSIAGCMTINMPGYISDKHPYKRRIASDYDSTLEATKLALKDLGWEIEKEVDPSLYERAWQIDDPAIKHTLILTKYSTSNYFVSSQNIVLNAYVRSNLDATTDVELRYLNVSTISYKNFFKFRNDDLIEKIYTKIEENLK